MKCARIIDIMFQPFNICSVLAKLFNINYYHSYYSIKISQYLPITKWYLVIGHAFGNHFSESSRASSRVMLLSVCLLFRAFVSQDTEDLSKKFMKSKEDAGTRTKNNQFDFSGDLLVPGFLKIEVKCGFIEAHSRLSLTTFNALNAVVQ